MSILILGTVAFDKIETPYVKTEKIIGGAGTYIALAASYYSIDSSIVSIVGEDFPNDFLKTLEEKQINTQGIEVVKGGKTFFWSGKYAKNFNQRDTLVTELNVLESFDPKVPESQTNAEYLMLGNLTPAVQKKVIESMSTRPKLIVMDTMNFWMDVALQDLEETIRLVDVLCINDEEALQLSKENNLRRSAKKILEQFNLKYLIIKKGEHGALLFSKAGELFYVPALPLEDVKDPTGAGDSFAGGFIGYLAKTQDTSFKNMKQALINASAMASFCVQECGVKGLMMLSEEEIDSRRKEFYNLVNYSK